MAGVAVAGVIVVVVVSAFVVVAVDVVLGCKRRGVWTYMCCRGCNQNFWYHAVVVGECGL